MPKAETPGGGSKTERIDPTQETTEKIKLNSKSKLAEMSAIVPQIEDTLEQPEDDIVGEPELEDEGTYTEWIENELLSEDTPLNTEKRKVLGKIKTAKDITEEEKNNLLDQLVKAEKTEALEKLSSKL